MLAFSLSSQSSHFGQHRQFGQFNRNNYVRTARGATLIEVIVCVVVLAVGLLGVSSMQAESMKVNQGAYLRSQATVVLNDVLDRIRANRAGFEANAYIVNINKNTPHLPISDSCSTSCNPTEMATQDISEIATFISGANPVIPHGRIEINRNSVTNAAIVNVIWEQEVWNGSARVREERELSLTIRI